MHIGGKMSKAKWPSRKEIEKVIKEIESKGLWTLSLPENPTPLEQFRFDLQQKFVAYKLQNKISQRELAELLGIDETKVSKIIRNHLSEFSTDRLIRLYEKINPNVKLKVS